MKKCMIILTVLKVLLTLEGLSNIEIKIKKIFFKKVYNDE
jgi:hypothetical protein